jgi:hypothetical protein
VRGEAMLGPCAPTDEETAEPPFESLQIATTSPAAKRKRRPAGTPGNQSTRTYTNASNCLQCVCGKVRANMEVRSMGACRP